MNCFGIRISKKNTMCLKQSFLLFRLCLMRKHQDLHKMRFELVTANRQDNVRRI